MTELTAFERPSSRFRGFRWETTFDRGRGLLTLGFTDGSTWHYAGVPQIVFEDFLLARSRGKYFDTFIKPFYEATKELLD